MADQHIVRGLADGLMKSDVGARTAIQIIGEEGIVEGCESLVEARLVSLCRPFGGPFGSLPFELSLIHI